MLTGIGEDKTKTILSSFSCAHLNKDVDYFLHHKAIEFSKQGITKTHLVFTQYKDEVVLVGYYALTPKYVMIDSGVLTKNYRKRINRFARYNKDFKTHILSTVLIAQLGKNYRNGYEKLITGNELLFLACEQVKNVQKIIGGKTVYLECEMADHLLKFYDRNGFVSIGKRSLDKDEACLLSGEYLAQLLKFLN